MSAKTISAYSPTEAVLSDLYSRYKGATYDVSTAQGMSEAKDARREIRTWRTGLEKERVKAKAEALAHCQNVDSEAKRITTALLALEDPIDAQIKAEANRKAAEKEAAERVETARVAAIRNRVEALGRWPAAMIGRSAAQIAEAIAKLEATPVTAEAFAEAIAEAQATHAASLQQLAEMHRAAVASETERAELVRLKTEQVERERTEQARRAEEDRRRAETEAESRRAIEAQERAARERIEAEERAARAEREKADEAARQARLAEQARLDEERSRVEAQRRAVEAVAREENRKRDELLDARAMLATFRQRYGGLREFAGVVAAIDALAEFETRPGSEATAP